MIKKDELFKVVLIAIFSICIFILAGCNSTQPVYNIRQYPLPGYVSKYSTVDSIENCIVQGGYNAGWKMVRKGKQVIIGYVSDKDRQAMVRITFTKNDYNIEYLNSINFSFDGSKIDKDYNELIIKLVKNINAQLNTVANKLMFEKGDVYIKKIPADPSNAEKEL